MRHARPLAPLLLAVLTCALCACSHMPRMLGGSGDETLVLDGEQSHEATLRAGATLALDMRDPGGSGYVFAGAAFNPDMLRLLAIEPRDEGARVRYLFSALAPGQDDVIIKIRKKDPGYRPDVYKLVRVTITK